MPQPHKILVISLTRMGDIIQSIPFFRRLRIKHPDAEIHMLVEGCFAEVAGLVRGVDKVDVIRLEDVLLNLTNGKSRDLSRATAFYRDFVGALQREQFDEVWNLTHTRPSMVLNHLLAGEQGRGVTLDREGLQCVHSPWMMYFFATNLARPWCQFNLVDIYANCVDGVDWNAGRDLSLALPIPERRAAAKPASAWLAIHAGASQPSKQWPVEHYRDVARQLVMRKDVEIVLVGSRRDAELARAFEGIPRVRNLIGKTSVPQLATLLSHCQLLLTNDSGPMHLAAAVGTRVIDITVGSALASETAPYGEGHLVVEPDSDCFPCSPHGSCPVQRCAPRITPETVSMLVEWEMGWGPALAPDDLGACRVYRTQFSEEDGLLELKRIFSHVTCPRDELNALLRPAWLVALEETRSRVSPAAHVIPSEIRKAASRAGDVVLQIEDLAGQIARSGRLAGCDVDSVQRWGRTLQEQETVLRQILGRHGVLRSLLSFTDIARASLSGTTLKQQANETVEVYHKLNGLLRRLAATLTLNESNASNITLPMETEHENLA